LTSRREQILKNREEELKIKGEYESKAAAVQFEHVGRNEQKT
jgi:hypothetical protein